MDAGHRFVILTPLLLLLPVNKLDLLIIQVSKNNKLSRKFNHYSLYKAASIIPTTVFGVVQNFSSFHNITCNGTESTLSQCTVHTSECTPWCPHTNIAIQCFSKLHNILHKLFLF